MFFANDCFLYFRADEEEVCTVKQILQKYGGALGQQINFLKYVISFSRNVSDSRQREICSMLGVSSSTNHDTYLGIPSMVGKSKKKAMVSHPDSWSDPIGGSEPGSGRETGLLGLFT